MALRPFRPGLFRQLDLPSRSYASRAGFADKRTNARPLRNMPRKTRDSGLRQKRADQKRQAAIDNIPSMLDPIMPSRDEEYAKEARVMEEYVVERTPTKNLPIYQSRKRGGNLLLTKVRKIEGNREALRQQLELCLVPKPEYVELSPITGHIDIKVGGVYSRSSCGCEAFARALTDGKRYRVGTRTRSRRYLQRRDSRKITFDCPSIRGPLSHEDVAMDVHL